MSEIKPEKIIEDVYVATVTKDNRVILQDRTYQVIGEFPVGEHAGFLLEGVCICQRQENWGGEHEKVKDGSESFWFCLGATDKKTGYAKRAQAEIWDEGDGKKQVVMKQPSSGCGI